MSHFLVVWALPFAPFNGLPAHHPMQLLIAFIIGSAVLVLDVKSTAFIDHTCNWVSNLAECVLLVVTIIGLMLYNPLTLPSTINAFQV